MDINSLVVYIIFALVAVVFLLNMFKVLLNIFGNKKPKVVKELDPVVSEVRSQVNEEVRPHLNSLEGMYEKSASKEATLGSFVQSVFKDKFSAYTGKEQKIVEAEIDKCCADYEGAECKESFCLESAGISCPKT